MDVSGKRGWQGGANAAPNKRQNHRAALEDELIADAEAADADAEGYGEDEADLRQEEDMDIELDLGEAGRNWERPPPPELRPSRDPISAPKALIGHVLPASAGNGASFLTLKVADHKGCLVG